MSGSDDPTRSRARTRLDTATEVVATSTLRVALAILGLVILLFAVGRMVGFDIIGQLVAVLESPEGRWVVVALFALVLIVIALRGFRTDEA